MAISFKYVERWKGDLFFVCREIETLDILTDKSFSQKLQASIAQAEAENTISWEEAKIKLGI